MKNIQKNIEKLMLMNNIKTQTELLRKIAGKLNKNPYVFAENQKANFSKMLKGQRPMNDEFIVPLEEIFNIAYAEIVKDDQYKMPTSEKFKPFIKGIKYYAYVDEPKQYLELLTEITEGGQPVIGNYDEYDHTFIDYLVKYRSINGFKFLVKEFEFNYHPFGMFRLGQRDNIHLYYQDPLAVALTIINFDDPTMFNQIFDPFDNLKEYQYIALENLYRKPEFIEAILNNDHILKSLYTIKEVRLDKANPGYTFKNENEQIKKFINPVLFIILDYALRLNDKYRNQAIDIIKYGIKTNPMIIANLTEEWHISEGGFVKYIKNPWLIFGTVLVSKYEKIGDKEIDNLIARLNQGVNYVKQN